MKRSMFLKIFTGYLLITIILSGLILLFSFTTIRHNFVDATAQQLRHTGMALKAQLVPLLEQKKTEELDMLAKKLGKETSVRITIIATDGRVLADSEENPAAMENHRTRTEVAQALESGSGRFMRVSGTLRQEMLYIALPLDHKGKVAGVLRLSIFLKDLNTTINHIRNRILIISLLIILASLMVAALISRNFSRPVKELIAASRRIAKEDFNVRVLLQKNDELKELADSFNYMAAQIKRLFAELSHNTEELNGLINALQEGFLVLDKDDRISLSNASFRRIVENRLVDGRFFWEIFREPRFDELIKKVREGKLNRTEDIEFRNRVFLCSATYLGKGRHVAIVMSDITDVRKVEKIKTDFVSNVSHELRTPLTAIKGFVETLEDTVTTEESRRYIDIIKRNTDRLINLISDLLLLSELEERPTAGEFTDVDVKILAENIIKIFEQRLKEKKLSYAVMADENLKTIMADPFKLEQMFINLIDNAVKYTEKGGITISIREQGDGVEITVEDTGIGIPGEQLPRIFERFYVVDKSRSKRLGGTGLGLSIVKHVVLLHEGTIDVKSTPGAGTKVLVTLPRHIS